MYANLDLRETIPAAFDVNKPYNTANFSASINVYDSLVINHNLTIYFRKSDEFATGSTWQWFVVVNGMDSVSGKTEIQAQGMLKFDSNGALYEESAITYPTGGFDFKDGAVQDQVIKFNFGTSIIEGGSGLDGITQFGASSALIYLLVN
jgi:flagellar hook protein FlgE